MRIYFVRHGIAEHAAPGTSDADRALTDRGIAQLKQQALALARTDQQLDRLFTSPLRRARQTAEVLGEALGVEPETDDLLRPGCTLDDVAELLGRYEEEELSRVMVVGHQPDMGRLIYALSGCLVRVPPGSISVVKQIEDFEEGEGDLYAHLEPEALARYSPED